ncbi:MAG: low molecular weight protein arginine phosphatase [Nibricoccus sp.]
MAEPGYIVTVCTANICRSPMAQALLQHALSAQPEPLKSIQVYSAGVSAYKGDRVSENSVQALRKVGLNLTGHTAQPLTAELVRNALAVFCMTEAHRSMIQRSFNPPEGKVHLFRGFLPAPANPEICDPYGGSLKHYEAARDEMVEAIPSLVAYIRTLFPNPAPAAK